MAKRGYRGKHPHNDMKVSPKNPSSAKYNSKLTTEYNKLKDKQKYSYIRSNYFFPQATMTISGTVNFAANSTLSMSAYDGTLLKMSGSTVQGNAAFKANGNSLQNAQSFRDIVNTGLPGRVTASIESVAGGTATTNDAIIKLTMVEPGPDGNTVLKLDGGSKATDKGVTFNGIAANVTGSHNESGTSGSLFTGG